MKHQREAPPSIRDERPDAPEDLVAICLKMMAKKPSARYQTAAEVAQALRLWLINHGYEVPESDTRLPKPVKAAPAGATKEKAPVRGLVSAKALPDSPAAPDTKTAVQTAPRETSPKTEQSSPNLGVPVAKPLEGANTLPIAKPLVETATIPHELVDQAGDEAEASPFPLPLPADEDPRLALVLGGRARRSAPPMPFWIWIIIALGLVTAVVLAIIQFV